jgi:hypothetical protein
MPRKPYTNPYVNTHQTLWNHPATDLRAGDIWDGSDQVLVTAVEILSADSTDPAYPNGRVRATGQIIRGYAKSKKLHNWSFVPEQKMDILRPQETN